MTQIAISFTVKSTIFFSIKCFIKPTSDVSIIRIGTKPENLDYIVTDGLISFDNYVALFHFTYQL